ncbi:MAG: cytochrome c oxidase subunit I [Dehalococcoidales bacterium]
MSGKLKLLVILLGAGAGVGVTALSRWGLSMPAWEPAPIIIVGFFSGLFAFLVASLGLKKLLSIDAARGALAGLAGTGIGVGITMLIRYFLGRPAWDEGAVLTVGIFTGVITYLIVLGVFRYWMRWATGAKSQEDEPPKRGLIRYFSVDTNHKVIGVQYFVAGLTFLPFAVALQLIGRVHMSDPGLGLLNNSVYESVISDHGVLMLFMVVLPIFSGMMNYFVPLQIGSREVAFPRLNAFTFWLVPAAGLLAVFSLMVGGFDTGWTAYPPLSTNFEPTGMNLIIIGVFLMGLSSILTAVNILTTIFKMRAPGMTFFRMPIFIWTTLATVGLSLVFTQFIGMSFLMLLFERVLGMGFFEPGLGGQPLLYQFLFWFYSHPAVYIFVLIGLGMISDIIPVFVRKPLFGYKGVAISSLGIAFGGTVVFMHHMFAAGMPAALRVPFMVTTLLVAVPTGVKVFAWVATTWMGKMRLNTPLLFVFSAVILFLIGGLTGVPLGIVPVDLYLHDSYWVVGHFHAMFFGGFLLPVMAAIYYWFPKVSGRMLREGLGKIQWLLMTMGMFLLVISMLGLGLEGMRRRVADYALDSNFQWLHVATAVGGFLVFAGIVILIYNLVVSYKRGAVAGDNPWEARTLEWLTSSPPPENNFTHIPEVLDRPHLHGVAGSVHARVGPKPDGEKQQGQGG